MVDTGAGYRLQLTSKSSGAASSFDVTGLDAAVGGPIATEVGRAPPPLRHVRPRPPAGVQIPWIISATWNAISSDCWWFRRGSTSVS